MNFPNDDSIQTGIINVSYTTPYSSITNPNILFNDFKVVSIILHWIPLEYLLIILMHLELILINVYMVREQD